MKAFRFACDVTAFLARGETSARHFRASAATTRIPQVEHTLINDFVIVDVHLCFRICANTFLLHAAECSADPSHDVASIAIFLPYFC
jgi:hypothetical protein